MDSKEKDFSICKFCGQLFTCDKDEDFDEYALQHCNCSDAKAYRQKKKYISKAKNVLREIFAEQLMIAEAKTSDEDIGEIREKLEVFLPLLVDFKIYSMSLSVANFGKINISINSDGNIKIKRSVGSSIERKI